ncbi:response regulator [Notoacmeibacter sp. MSK16QG-6]|uniref:response regulator n=1 Tax=Notoacmeibacter sp. MSK16QG-6 TaxID=2957982 RepID=UPI00209F05CA|nr:response regulator [Notoacmeibacter sp. MSK16QG-6]MCP1200995.1 response regulator [Notoacmeibacter sp. MSK16QG-6]
MTEENIIVLLVEDVFLIRDAVAEHLKAEGFLVFEAANAKDAIRRLETEARIDVVFTDIEMPGDMDGRDLALAVLKRWPGVSVILTSGQVVPDAEELAATAGFFGKPYDHAHVAAACRGAVT